MLKKSITAGDIGRSIGVTRAAVNAVIKGIFGSPRIQTAISAALGLSPEKHEKLWGKKQEDKAA